MLVSVCVLVTRAREDITPTLRSVLRQDHRDIECLITNTGNHPSLEAARAVVGTDPRVRWMPVDRNASLFAMSAECLRHSRGEHVLFLSSQDLLFRQAISTLSDVLNRWTEASFVYCPVVRIDEHNRIRRLQAWTNIGPHMFEPGEYIRLVVRGEEPLVWAGTLARRDALLRSGSLRSDLPRTAHLEQLLRMNLRHPVVYFPRPLAALRIGHCPVPDDRSPNPSEFLHELHRVLSLMLEDTPIPAFEKNRISRQLRRRMLKQATSLENLKGAYELGGCAGVQKLLKVVPSRVAQGRSRRWQLCRKLFVDQIQPLPHLLYRLFWAHSEFREPWNKFVTRYKRADGFRGFWLSPEQAQELGLHL